VAQPSGRRLTLSQAPVTTKPELIVGVTPFLLWASPPEHNEPLDKDFEARVVLAELDLKHGHGATNLRYPMDLFHSSFDDDIYGDMVEKDHAGLQSSLYFFKSTQPVEQQTFSTVSDYLDHMSLILEAFMPKDSALPLARKLYGAMAKTIDVCRWSFRHP
jgi:hypothetical protein